MRVSIGPYKENGERDSMVEISKHDLYSLDATLKIIIHPALVKFKEVTPSYPIDLSVEAWNEVLDKMIYSFDPDRGDEWSPEHFDKIQEGFDLFGKYFRDLWC